MFNTASDIYYRLLGDYELQYIHFSNEKKIKKYSKHNFIDLFLDEYNYDNWFDKSNNKELIELLEGDEKVLSAKIKPGNNSYKLKNKIKQMLYL